MRSSLLLKSSSLLLSLLRLASAQSIVPTSSSAQFPSCALSCTVLLQAQTACVPPLVPVTNQITYENCFCQSSLLQALYSTPDAICTAECTSESDRTLLQTWFTNFCQQVGRGIDPLASTTSVLQPSSTAVVTITSYSTPPAATNTGTGSASGPAPHSHQSWIDGHWRWILMIGVLAVGFGLLTWLAIWFKRRHNRKIEERRAAASGFPTADEQRGGARSATPDLWGPHQHMHYTKGWEYHNDPAVMGGGVLASSSSRRDRKSKRASSQGKHRDLPEMAELGGGRPPASRQHSSSKGKARATDEIMPVESETRHADRSRSRSQRRRNLDSDPERSQVDSEHQRRLREVRGSRRKKDADQT
ncbi:uncharacterized protein Z519_04498 [Cladophialophora bantiana CBS 173.52]|uniref:Integral membrane protein n=1 Tax=Cladophialophora bantiana (strain ATCC 10958 / CBS 173.52 / CDC B-1940 / NIH 8579) TaxID=1442370 RepID=A0A0D2G7E4_CLAB1|nr:uncharacterized protein Z519_04498 [Cladophialophora bantiana CBS 173.52]KIW94522.1 hypothetical protein Z519_04498 [Cladophialophora bantiana CBS 173.52]